MKRQRPTKKKPTPKAKLPAHLRLGRLGVHGYGLFARAFMAAGEKVIEYVGPRITKAESRRRELARIARRNAGGDGCVYDFELNQRHDLNGDVPWNLARRINHSCGPNCVVDIIRGRIWILARRDIAPGEELNYNYGFDFADWHLHPCRCGAAECVGYIVNPLQRWRVRRIVQAK